MTPPKMAPKVAGVIPSSSTIIERLPSHLIVIDDENAERWLPVLERDEIDGRNERFVNRSTLAFRLRATGMSYEDIAAAFAGDDAISPLLPTPYGAKQVRDDVAIYIEHLRSEVQEALADVVTIEIERFDLMLAALWPAILEGDTASINTALKVSERRSRLLGLDQPIRIDWRIELSSLLQEGAITVEDVRQQLGDEDFGQFVQYLEERNEDLTHSDSNHMRFLFGQSQLAGRFLPLVEEDDEDLPVTPNPPR